MCWRVRQCVCPSPYLRCRLRCRRQPPLPSLSRSLLLLLLLSSLSRRARRCSRRRRCPPTRQRSQRQRISEDGHVSSFHVLLFPLLLCFSRVGVPRSLAVPRQRAPAGARHAAEPLPSACHTRGQRRRGRARRGCGRRRLSCSVPARVRVPAVLAELRAGSGGQRVVERLHVGRACCAHLRPALDSGGVWRRGRGTGRRVPLVQPQRKGATAGQAQLTRAAGQPAA